MYDAASTIMAQKISQIIRRGPGFHLSEAAPFPAVRVELNPMTLNKYGISLEERAEHTKRDANANVPKGSFFGWPSAYGRSARAIRFLKPKDYRAARSIAYRNGSAVRVSDIRRR